MEKCIKCGSTNIVNIEYSWDVPEHYDGISEHRCMDCRLRIGRWSRQVLQDGEYENPRRRFDQNEVK